MAERHVAPFGSWKSPITSDLIAAESIGLGRIALDGDDIYWVEQRPSEGGRNVVVRRTPDGQTADVTPEPFNARSRVHEYGGGAFAVADRTIYFSNYSDQRLYRQRPGGQPEPVTPAEDMRYADGIIDRRRRRMICVREDHTVPAREPLNTIVSIELDRGATRVLVTERDFVSSPRLSPDGSRLAWLAWDHPNMPWDGTELWVGELGPDGTIGDRQLVAGRPGESVSEPRWSPDSILHFVSDRTGWWNLYRWRNGQHEALCEMEAEFTTPGWVFGASTYGFASAERIICAYNEKGTWHIANLYADSLGFERVPMPFTELTWAGMQVSPRHMVMGEGSPTEPEAIRLHDLVTGQTTVLRRSVQVDVDIGYLSIAQPIEFPTENGLTAHAFFYAPKNSDYTSPPGEKPPLIVMSHGGPTGATSSTLHLGVQYWTSRGFAVVDVNYGGSTGYGTAYRRRLNGNWGVVDVDDCVNATMYLARRGDVDMNRLIIRGGSAGGYTTLATLAFRKVFKAGASYFGLSELEVFVRDTHKFESRYLHSLIGPYPQRRDLYIARSPIHHLDKLSCPIILFQGLEDKIVPPNQSEMIFDALKRKGVPTAYVPFEGEQHGFRRAENIKRSLDSELDFYSRVFRFALAEPVEPVRIENL